MDIAKKKLLLIAEGLNAVEQVYFINRVFGNAFKNNDSKTVINQLKNIYDEIEEFDEAILSSNKKEKFDAIGDILTFAYGAGYLMGIEWDKVVGVSPSPIGVSNVETIIEQITHRVGEHIELLENNTPINDTWEIYFDTIALIKLLVSLYHIDEDHLMSRITNSNITKVCTDFNECQATVDFYTNLGVEVYSKYYKTEGMWIHVVYSAKEQKDFNGKIYRANKFLKSINFQEPDLDFYLQ